MRDDSDHDDPIDPTWFAISRFRPDERGPRYSLASLLGLLKHARWEVRWNAARELFFRADKRSVDGLIDLLRNDPVNSVRRMAAQALGALHEKGVPVSLYQSLSESGENVRAQVALQRLAELGVEVTVE